MRTAFAELDRTPIMSALVASISQTDDPPGDTQSIQRVRAALLLEPRRGSSRALLASLDRICSLSCSL
jgi:hypothetical protein